ncbi:MAG: hypothetical protein NC311_05455 [Muribaculaceae bacterium]|nr:hypothetical protein [Muribaculaceae bacterium]
MKNIVFGIAVVSMLHISNAVAGTPCAMVACPADKIPSGSSSSNPGCKDVTVEWRCYYNSSGTLVGPFLFCYNGCKDGYTYVLDSNFLQDKVGCNALNSAENNVRYTCKSNAELCGTCNSDAWSEIPSIPYARRTLRYCDGATCKSQTQIGCKVGYYGTPTQIGSGCTQCPKFGDVTGTTAEIGATSVTECYVTSGTFCDNTGCGTCDDNAYYVN